MIFARFWREENLYLKSRVGCTNCRDEGTARNQPKGTVGITDLKLTASNPWFVRMDISTWNNAKERHTHAVSLQWWGQVKHCQFAGFSPLLGVFHTAKRKDFQYPILSDELLCLSDTMLLWKVQIQQVILAHICRQQIASPGSSLENPERFGGKAPCGARLHIIPSQSAGNGSGFADGKDAETRPFASSPPPRTEMFAQGRAGRNTNAAQQGAEGRTGRREERHKGNKQAEMRCPSRYRTATPGHAPGPQRPQGSTSARCQPAQSAALSLLAWNDGSRADSRKADGRRSLL